MYEDGYVDLQQLDGEDEQSDSADSPIRCLSYSSGRYRNGAVGLCNIGGMCCLNPLLQTLYMYKEFTDTLCRIGVPGDDVPPEKRLPYELLSLFEEMQDSQEDAVPPYRLLRCLQMLKVTLVARIDVVEVFSSFWDHLIRDVPNPDLEEELRSLYNISLEEHVTCQRCRHQSSAHRDLLSLPLRVSRYKYHKTSSLERALSRYFLCQDLDEEENFCSKCGNNTRASKVTNLRSLPRTLTFHLRRLCKKKREKINSTVTFPPELDLQEVLSPRHLPPDQQPEVSWDDVKCTYGNTAFHWGATAVLLIYVPSARSCD
ncbi:ubl carboxyl-terminal hydrolase 18 isoform X2 [Engystomops pustulosus]|uniref:ubl carboxyl-terminal hydrolase 18 isoform X2 n=1 Tax=Engystomops pustulosus TaxID=76066 RepID=UPI003AFA6BBA